MHLNSRFHPIFWPVIGYIIVSIIATWPLITHLNGWVPGVGDWGQNMWALWWTRHSLLSLQQFPFFTNYLFYPEGVTLLFHPIDVSDGLVTIPLYGLLGSDRTYNFIVLLSFVLGGWGSYLLAFYLTHNRWASFMAGLIFVLSPYHMQRIDIGHLNLSTVQWIPFYILFLLKFIQQGHKRSGILATFFLVFMALNSWYYVVYCGLISLALILYPRQSKSELPITDNQSRLATYLPTLIRVFVVLFVAVIILSPLIIPMLNLLSSTILTGEHDPQRHSVDIYSFWVPGPPSTWASWFEDVWISYAAHDREPGASAYLGYIALILSGIALFQSRWRRQTIWWVSLALGATLLALGPQLQIDGQPQGITLPYQWLTTLVPIFSITGIPGRFVVITSLALAMLAAYGLTHLARYFPKKPALYLVIALLIGLEYLALPIRLTPTTADDFYHTLAEDEASYAILDIKWDANFLLHRQTIHGKPLVGGWLARLPEKQAAYLNQGGLDKSFLYLLLGPEGVTQQNPAQLQTELQTALTDHQIRYIIDHGNVAGPWLEQFIGWPAIYEGDEIVVYGRP